MKEVKTQKRYKCDFCKRRSTKAVMLLHEKRCYRNPARFCDYCKNKGYTDESVGGDGELSMWEKVDCPYCSKFSATQLKEIETREASLFAPSVT